MWNAKVLELKLSAGFRLGHMLWVFFSLLWVSSGTVVLVFIAALHLNRVTEGSQENGIDTGTNTLCNLNLAEKSLAFL